MELLEEVTHTHKTHACSNKSLNRKMIFQSMDGHSSCIDPFNLSISTSISISEVADAGWDGNTDIRQVKLESVENHHIIVRFAEHEDDHENYDNGHDRENHQPNIHLNSPTIAFPPGWRSSQREM